MRKDLPRLMIAAPGSGCGKTTLVCGLLRLFQQKGLCPAAFKCGPDFIDPLFHRQIVGVNSGSLDLFFTGEDLVRSLLGRSSEGCGIALLEGAMGYYDGIGITSQGSSYHLARVTGTPVILILTASGAALSLAALAHGFATFQPDANIQGFVLNQCSQSLYASIAPAIREHTGIPVVGYLPKHSRYAIPSRHLGLVTADEIMDLQARLEELADTMSHTLDVEAFLSIAASPPPLEYDWEPPQKAEKAVGLAIAHDQAFCFYYQENLHLLEELGVTLFPFSPLNDPHLPPDIHGLYLGGGYPELYGEALSKNVGMLTDIRRAVEAGMPVVAEGGGFLYLQESLQDDEGHIWPMARALEGTSQKEARLRQFGYIHLTAQQDNLYGKQGESIPAHEYHYWHSTLPGNGFRAQKPHRDAGWPCMVAKGNLVAGFPHLYYPANPSFAVSFVEKMAAYKEKRL